eukprot:GHUV01001229.1.p1 GENE.GHUV01001229.1~~GHUV01001229.1.p1  ORF type:complete len:474 (+),score=182.08 GHUV01001229.1:261-1682(+)
MERFEGQMQRLGLQEAEEADIFDSVDTQPVEEHEGEAAEEADSDYLADDMTCAICLERTDLTDIALVKGCEHQYCVHCILQWAMCKEWCPQCKKPFDYLLTHRQLDGTLTDYLTEESVVLLKRARWFEDHVKEKEQSRIALQAQQNNSNAAAYASAAAAEDGSDARDWADYYEDYVDAELEEDEEIEQYYFSSAAGRARVVLGNRRWGEGGYMRAGRMYARPVPHRSTPNAAGGKLPAATNGKAAKTPASAKGKGAGSSSSGSSPPAAVAAGTPTAGSSGAGSSSAAAAVSNRSAGSGSSSGGGARSLAGAGSSSAAAAGPTSSSRSRGRTTSIAAWVQDDEEDDFTVYDYDDDDLSNSGGRNSNRRNNSSSRSRSRPDRPAGMVKPIRQIPKNSPACCIASGRVVNTPLGKSPGSGNFTVGSWGAAGSSGGGLGASPPSMGSTPGSGRRAKRNARRAAVDAEGGAGAGCEWD